MSLEEAVREMDRDYSLRLSRLLWSFGEPGTIHCQAEYGAADRPTPEAAVVVEVPEPVAIEEPAG